MTYSHEFLSCRSASVAQFPFDQLGVFALSLFGDVQDLEALTLRDLAALGAIGCTQKIVQRGCLVLLQQLDMIFQRVCCQLLRLEQLSSAHIDLIGADAIALEPCICLAPVCDVLECFHASIYECQIRPCFFRGDIWHKYLHANT